MLSVRRSLKRARVSLARHARMARDRRQFDRLLNLELLEPRRLLASDFGDAPAPYPTLITDDGAVHTIVSGFHLGSAIDAEANGQPSLESDRDDRTLSPDDEDGVTNVGGGGVMIDGGLKRGSTAAQLEVFVTNSAGVTNPYLDAWIDFNQDGDWTDPGERIASQAVLAGSNTVTFAVPMDAELGVTVARFRLHSATGPGLLPTGAGGTGEVEDHRVIITFDVYDPYEVGRLLANDAATDQNFGNAVSVSGDLAVIGAVGDGHAGTASGAAYVLQLVNGLWTQQAKLTAADAAAFQGFGNSVSIAGDTAVVGAMGDDDAGVYSGSAYVFQRVGGIWTQQAKLTASDAASYDYFGVSVAISGDTIIVGSDGDEPGVGADAGSAYVFTRSGGSWSEQAKLTPSDEAEFNRFGSAVSVSGDTALIGAAQNSAAGPFAGAAYVFRRSGSIWTEQVRLTAADAGADDFFGFSVSVSGDTALVGAGGSGTGYSGAAYVYVRTNSGWYEQAKLTASDAADEDYFGISVSLSGDTAVVGAYGDDDQGSDSGSAYVFSRSNGPWTEQTKLIGSGGDAGDLFGSAVGLSGDQALIGAQYDSDILNSAGSVYAFDLERLPDYGDAPLPYPTTLAHDGARHTIVPGFQLGATVDAEVNGQPNQEANADDRTGSPDDEDGVTNVGGGDVTITEGLRRGDASAQLEVFVSNSAGVANPYLDAWVDFNQDGDWDDAGERITSQAVVAGSNVITFAVPEDAELGETVARFRLHSATGPGLLPTGAADTGEVEDHRVVITFDINNPAEVSRLLSADVSDGDNFGISLSVSGDTAIIGACGDDQYGGEAGAAYLYTFVEGRWMQQARLTAPDAAAQQQFGCAVALSDDVAVVGAYGDAASGYNSGAAYVFERFGSSWTYLDKLTASDAGSFDYFGISVSVAGNTIVVGADGDEPVGSDAGSAYVFTRFGPGYGWSEDAKLTPGDPAAGDRFGNSVSVSGDTVVVGAFHDSDAGSMSGSAYVFTRLGSSWAEQTKLTAGDAAAGDYFGISVSLSGDTAVVGAIYDSDAGDSSGSAYVFVRSGANWTQQDKLTASDAAAYDEFGYSVAVSGDTAIIGAYSAVFGGDETGAVYVFSRSNGSWSEQARLTAAESVAGDALGTVVSLSGETALVGAPFDSSYLSSAGSAYVFNLNLSADYGDAPTPYPTLQADSGAAHTIIPGFHLGATADFDVDGRPSLEVNADDRATAPDDEDGVTNVGGGGVMITGGLTRGDAAAQLEVVVTNSAGVAHPYLDAWIDFNQDGDWNDAGERITSQAVVAGTNIITFAVPESAEPGETVARFRLHSATGPGLLPTGMAGAGEVEDHRVVIRFDLSNPLEVTELLANDATANQYFGDAVSISGNTAVIGASGDGHAGSDSGAAYVYTLVDGLWLKQARLTAPDATAQQFFGASVAVSGNFAVIGAYGDSEAGFDGGAAYVFERDGNEWHFADKLLAASPEQYFGYSVSISGETAIIGAPIDSGAGLYAGVAYVFVRDGGSWKRDATLTASDAGEEDIFGVSVSIAGDTAIVGAYGDSDSGLYSGAAYVFSRDGGGWTQQAKLTASDAAPNHQFGTSVSVSGDTAVVGAMWGEKNGVDSGAAYVFVRSGTTWTQQAKLTASDAAYGDSFGISVTAAGDTVVIGAPQDDDAGPSSGSAYVFVRSGTSWVEQAKLAASDAGEGDLFGEAVGLSGDLLLVGAANHGDQFGNAGSTYVFDLELQADFGDAPASYGTALEDSGAYHYPNGPFLGAVRDIEHNGVPSGDASSDDLDDALDDEDGVQIETMIAGSDDARVTVKVANVMTTARLDGWIDFDGDGAWGADEQVLNSIYVSNGTAELQFAVPVDAVTGITYARFRVSSAGGLPPTGWAPNGEVEDYEVVISKNLVVDLPSGSGANDVTVRRNGDDLEVWDNSTNTLLASSPVAYTSALVIQGSETEVDSVHVDYSAGGFFALPDHIDVRGGGTSGDSLRVTGDGTTRGEYSMAMSPIGTPLLRLNSGGQSDSVQYDEFENLIFDGLLTFSVEDVLDVGSNAVAVDAWAPVNLGPLTLLSGGLFSSTSPLALGSGESILGFGTIAARLSGEAGSLIEASGDLAIGDALSTSGFLTRGDLVVGDAVVTLLDANQAVLGTQTSLGQAGTPGVVIAGNGLLVDFGNNVVGYGMLQTPDDLTKPLIVNGLIQGDSAVAPITLSGYVKGVGTLDQVNVTGTYSPGFSPAAVQNGSLTYGSTGRVVLELGGTVPGSSGHDQVNHVGTAVLGGHLEVELINGFVPAVGDTFVLMTATEQLAGEFTSVALPAPPTGTGWSLVRSAQQLTLQLVDVAQVESVVVGDGSSARSMVSQLVVTFDQLMVLDAGVFQVTKRGPTGGPVDVTFTTTEVNNKTVATLTFSGEHVQNGSLVDGNYDLTIDASRARTVHDIELDGDNDGQAGGDYVFGADEADAFFRLYGDRDGSRFVGNNDYALFRLAFRKSPGQDGYDAQFDSDNSDFIGNNDYALFRLHFRTGLSFE